jgi:hypothetical protein
MSLVAEKSGICIVSLAGASTVARHHRDRMSPSFRVHEGGVGYSLSLYNSMINAERRASCSINQGTVAER